MSSIEFDNSSISMKQHGDHYDILYGGTNISDSFCPEKNNKRFKMSNVNILDRISHVGTLPSKNSYPLQKEVLKRSPKLSECSEEDCFKVFHNDHFDHLIDGRLFHYEKYTSLQSNAQFPEGENVKLVDCGPLKFVGQPDPDVDDVTSGMNSNNIPSKIFHEENPTTSIPAPAPTPAPVPVQAYLNQSNRQLTVALKHEELQKEEQNQSQAITITSTRRRSLPHLMTLPCGKCKDKDSSEHNHTSTFSNSSSWKHHRENSLLSTASHFGDGLDLDTHEHDTLYGDKLCCICLESQDPGEEVTEELERRKSFSGEICDDIEHDHIHHHLVLHDDHMDTLDSLGFLHCSRLERYDK